MYSETEIPHFVTLTKKLQTQVQNLNFSELEALKEVLRFHEHRYYILNNPLISDFEYDMLYKGLEKIEAENPLLITPDSPTQRVAKGLTKEFFTVQHLVPMLSLENSYNEADLITFDKKIKETLGEQYIEYCIEPKYDGGSISLLYENNQLTRGATRGNGTEGDEITQNIKQIKSIPLSANFAKYGLQAVEIRGEVLINKKNFAAYNQLLTDDGLAPLANPRNAASGTLRIKDPREVSKRNLEAFVYHISYYTWAQDNSLAEGTKEFVTHAQALEMLWELGFKSPVQDKKIFNQIEDVIAYCNHYETIRDSLPYEIDGMVIKVNSFDYQDKLGITSHHPRWAIAYKFKARQATSKLLQVDFQVGRTGSVTPVAKIEPVPIGGVMVQSVSLFNQDNIKEKNLKIGDTVLVERAGDVIPYIVKPILEARTGEEQEIEFPERCPRCNSTLYRVEGEAAWRCANIECPAQAIERIIHFAAKDAMDIRGLGDAVISKLYALGLLQDIPGIYQLDYEKISSLEGFGKRSVEKLQQAIEQSKKQPLNRLIFGLGIRFVGETTAKTLANNTHHLLDIKDHTIDSLSLLQDIGPKVAASITQFFSNETNINILQSLEQQGLLLKNTQKDLIQIGALSGKTFLFTGTLPTLKRNEAEALAEKQGGKILGSVSANLDFLVAGESAGSKLEKAKKINSVRIITELEFLELIQQSQTQSYE